MSIKLVNTATYLHPITNSLVDALLDQTVDPIIEKEFEVFNAKGYKEEDVKAAVEVSASVEESGNKSMLRVNYSIIYTILEKLQTRETETLYYDEITKPEFDKKRNQLGLLVAKIVESEKEEAKTEAETIAEKQKEIAGNWIMLHGSSHLQDIFSLSYSYEELFALEYAKRAYSENEITTINDLMIDMDEEELVEVKTPCEKTIKFLKGLLEDPNIEVKRIFKSRYREDIYIEFVIKDIPEIKQLPLIAVIDQR